MAQFFSLLLLLTAPLAAADFVRDVFPVLERRCFGCHGAKVQMARLRLDGKAGFERGGQSGSVANAGDAAGSLLLKRVEARDGASPMPPAGERLSAPEIAALRSWIEAGAVWPAGIGAADGSVTTHWAYVAPRRPAMPAVQNETWVRNEIDRLLLARMEKEGFEPGPEASKETLVRRVALDLTGLPPSVAEIDRFLADSSPRAYESLVDRMLDSPHYGERWAQMWLDLARYADTNGYESDEPRTQWAWRDWVVSAFNRNLSFDRFTIEQIAGDLLPGATEDQIVATGFHRNTLVNSEAGSKDDEFRDAAMKDRVDTTATVWLGSTLGCAQCHNHKYDPFTQRDYYGFYAYFNNTAESAIKLDQELTVFRGDRAERDRLADAVAPWRAKFEASTPELDRARTEWETRMREQLPAVEASWKELGAVGKEVRELRLDAPVRGVTVTGKGKLRVEAWTPELRARHESVVSMKPEWGTWYTMGPFETFTPEEAHRTAWPPEKELRLDASYEGGKYTWRERPEIPNGKQQQLDGYNCAMYVYREVRSPVAQTVTVNVASELGVQVWLNGNKLAESAPLEPLPEAKERIALNLHAGSNQLLLKYTNGPGYYRMFFESWDGLEREAVVALRGGDGVFALERAAESGSVLRISYQPAADESAGAKVAVSGADVRLWVETPAPAREALLALSRTPEQDAAVASEFRRVAPELAVVRAEYEARKKALDQYVKAHSTSVLVMKELAEPRDTYVQPRGDFLSKLERIYPATPASLPRVDGPPNRLGLARWLVDRSNPLTARVTVNHFWRELFGVGLVKTMEDFGAQGDRPTNPELLDWLAVDFMESGWDVKALLKKIAMSAAYRQSSIATPEKIARDPDNKLMARAPRFRLTGEGVRDAVLAASGLLSRKLGGPAVFPPIPASLFDSVFVEGGFQAWPTSTGEDRHRRGLYTFVKRTFAYPPLMTFDAPDRTTCTVDRPRSNTPLQALTTLNDEAFVEAAGAMAAVLRDQGLGYGFRAATGRRPAEPDLAALNDLFARMKQRYDRDPAAGRALALSARAPSADLVPWIVVANVILNLDETVTRE
ncbi:MAG: PSD1 and planctomycete cytochrome C domain-containing protein [Bryobacteraceae bacterium]